MELIIDIPEETYKEVIECKDTSNTNIYTAIKNGTPLDDVKAEINKTYYDVTMYSCDEQVSYFASRVSEILDNISKESEE